MFWTLEELPSVHKTSLESRFWTGGCLVETSIGRSKILQIQYFNNTLDIGNLKKHQTIRLVPVASSM